MKKITYSIAFVTAIALLMSVGSFFVAFSGTAQATAANENNTYEPTLGSITVCKIIVNSDDEILDGSTAPQETSFEISSFTPNPETSEGAPMGEFGSASFTTPLSFNETFFDAQAPNAECETFSDLPIGGYYYEEEIISDAINWEEPQYNDQFTTEISSLSDFFAYSGELFGKTGTNNQNSDGHIVLTTERPNRTLVVLNTLLEEDEPTSTITIYKDAGDTNEEFAFTADYGDFALASGDSNEAQVDAGTYEVREDVPTGWEIESISCEVNENPELLYDNDENLVGVAIVVEEDAGEWCIFKNKEVDDPQPTEPTATLTSDPETINEGESSTLTWDSENALVCIGTGFDTSDATSGSLEVSPTETTEYSVECEDDDNQTASDSAIVTVVPEQEPLEPTATLTADPETIDTGESSTLTWSSENASICTSLDFETSGATAGSLEVSPTETTEYSITCEGDDNQEASDLATVTVNTGGGGGGSDDPTVTLTADPETIDTGATSTLSWTSEHADSCTSPDFETADAISGSVEVSPDATKEYSITCEGDDDKEASDTTTVTVNEENGVDEPTVTLTADPDEISQGASSTLVWDSENATSCTSLDFETGGAASGTVAVAPTTTTAYSITCEGEDDKEASDGVTITVLTGGSGGGGGGGSGGGGGGTTSTSPSNIVPSTTFTPLVEPVQCDYLKDFLRIDLNNNPVEVLKLQMFLNIFEDGINVPVTATFDQATFNGVVEFQERYFDEVLEPWGHSAGTGYVYLTTRKKVNEIYCQQAFPLTSEQQEEVLEFRAFIQQIEGQLNTPQVPVNVQNQVGSVDSTENGLAELPTSEEVVENFLAEQNATESSNGQSFLGAVGNFFPNLIRGIVDRVF